MPSKTCTCKTESPALARQLKNLDKGIRQLEAQTSRRLAEPVVASAIEDGRIEVGDAKRWLERAERMGIDTVRDLLLERRPDRQLAAANAATAQQTITREQDRQLEQVFPGYKASEASA